VKIKDLLFSRYLASTSM